MTISSEIGRKAAQILDDKLASFSNLEERISFLAKEVEGRIAFSSSLGIEDQALLHGISGAGAEVDIFTLDTGRHFEETLETLERSELRYGRKIRVVVPERDELEELVLRDGIFGFRATVEARKECCDVRKVRPLRRSLVGASAWITGMRREQSSGRSDVSFAAWDNEHELIKLNPIADWSIEQLETYVTENNIPINTLHAQGYPSIGCQPCTRAIQAGEDVRAGRWWWENDDGKECGLHVAVPVGGPGAKASDMGDLSGNGDDKIGGARA